MDFSIDSELMMNLVPRRLGSDRVTMIPLLIMI